MDERFKLVSDGKVEDICESKEGNEETEIIGVTKEEYEGGQTLSEDSGMSDYEDYGTTWS